MAELAKFRILRQVGDWHPYLASPEKLRHRISSGWRGVGSLFEHCIDKFGPERCMFESNFPPDRESVSYPILWNAFKRIAGGYSADEKRALFHGTAAKAYRLNLD